MSTTPSPPAAAFDGLNVHLFKGSTNPQPVKVFSLSQALDAIQDGTYHQHVQQLRHILTTKGKSAYDAAKKHLDAVTFCGTFSPTRAKTNLTQHSGIIHGDLDHLDDLQAAKQLLCDEPWTSYCFVSPSGTGLKVGIRVEPVADDAAYKHAWQVIADYHQRQYGIVWDESGKDVSRLCYLSYDPEVYRNPDALLFMVPSYQPPPPAPPKPKPTLTATADPLTTDRRQRYGQQAIDTASKIIDASTRGNRHEARLRASRLLGGYISGGVLSYDEAYTALKGVVERNTDDVPRSLKTIVDGLRHGQDHPITFDELEAQHLDWLQAHRSTLGVNT